MISSIFGGGSEKETVSGVTTTKIPEWMTRAGQDIFKEAQPLTERPYPSFPVEDRVAPFSADTKSAFDLTRSLTGMSPGVVGGSATPIPGAAPTGGVSANWTGGAAPTGAPAPAMGGAPQPSLPGTTGLPIWMEPYLQGLQGIYRGTAATTGEDVSRLMNPFADQLYAEIDRQRQRNEIENNASMSRRGSYFNEDRREVVHALGDEAANRAIGSTLADNYFKALQGAQTDKGRAIVGGAAGIQGAGAGQRFGFTDVAGLMDAGQMQEMKDQTGKNLNYEEFLKSFYYPQEQQQWLMQLLGLTPRDTTVTSEQEELVGTPNRVGQILGAGTTIASLAAFSHPDLKTDKKPIEHILPRIDKMKIESWRYKDGLGDPATHIGPYADEWKDLTGTGDGVSIPFVDAFGVTLAGVQELNRKVDWLTAIADDVGLRKVA